MDKAVHAIRADWGFWQRVIVTTATGCVLDTMLLTAFAFSGTVALIVPVLYGACGLIGCACFYVLAARATRLQLRDGRLSLPLLAVSSAIQIVFIGLAPQVAFYFIIMLFLIFEFGSMRLPIRHSAITWIAVTLALGAVLYLVRRSPWIPQATATERWLVWLCCAATLGRFMLAGIFNRMLRIQMQERRRQLSESVETRDKSLEIVNAELLHQATHDALTGLPNRTLFADRLAGAVRRGLPFAVGVLDLDRFKVINDSLGHGAGDALLKAVAQRLVSSLRAQDTVGRAGGDEFLLLLQEVSSREEIDLLAGRWMAVLSESYRIQGTELHVSPSIGIARYPLDSEDAQELLARADEAMYHAKKNGRNMLRFFDSDVTTFSRENLAVESELRHALANSELFLHYQPRVEIATGGVRSVEALLRWKHPARGWLLPGEFIAIAEDTGLIVPIGEWVVREACRQARVWQLEGLPFLRVAVNVSPMQFRHPKFFDVVRSALETNALDAIYLEIELTEATLMTSAEKSVVMLEQLSELGIIVAIDDFGTGYSSMSYLQRFTIDELKIDCSFIRDLEFNPNDVSIVRAIISLAHELGLRVVAEGVESSEQLALLKRMGCDQYQGFLHSVAMAPSEIESLLGSSGARATDADGHWAERTYSKLARRVARAPGG
jgi:diguanylate cyclase (GGDEF)-like protein